MNFTDQFLKTIESARSYNLTTLNNIATLVYLSKRDNGAYPTAIADAVKTSTASMTQIIDKLEKGGLVEREFDPHDRRTRRVLITDKGLESVAIMFPIETVTP